MLGLRFIKSQPTLHLMQFRGGRLVREDAGQSFYYFAPTSTLVAVPLASQDRPCRGRSPTASPTPSASRP